MLSVNSSFVFLQYRTPDPGTVLYLRTTTGVSERSGRFEGYLPKLPEHVSHLTHMHPFYL